MFVGAAVVVEERRHVPGGVVLEQLDDPVDVLGPERLEVGVEHQLLGVVEILLDGVGSEAALVELRVGALEGRVDRRRRRVERGRGLGGRPPEHVAQDEYGALPRGQVLERGDERQPDRVALGDLDRRVGDRLQPRDVGVLLERVAGDRVGGAEAGRQRPARPALEVGQADVGGDLVEPGADRAAALEAGRRLPRTQERLLHQVLGLVDRPAHPVAVRHQLALVAPGQRVEVRELVVHASPGQSAARSPSFPSPTPGCSVESA